VRPEDEHAVVVRYHRLSTHRVDRFAPGPGYLDWGNQPHPFRTYEEATVVELPLADERVSPSWDALHRPGDAVPRPLDRASLGAFLELSLGLTAWKQAGRARWALRANPSSGNLHPTEGYVLVSGAPGIPAGLYHYSSRDHVLERRWAPGPSDAADASRGLPEGGFLFGLSSVHWREAWKYGVRAFRYCQHDAGHALAAARYAAGVLGWAARLLEAPGDADVAALLGLDREQDFGHLASFDREHPDALVLVAPPEGLEEQSCRVEAALDALVSPLRGGEWSGRPNRLSPEHVEWPEIEAVVEATGKPRTRVCASADEPRVGGSGADEPPGGKGNREIAAVRLIRQRRSAVAMDGTTALSSAAFLAMLDRLLPRPHVPPWDVLPWTPRVHPVLFLHRVEGLAPGLYLFERRAELHETLRAALRPSFRWERPALAPPELRLYLLEEGDARSFARLASCHQEIASDSAFSLGMLAELGSLAETPWLYRWLFWETGVLGQVLYLEAEASGVRSTGIGCYFDEAVHEVLGLESTAFRDLYHFTVGGAVEDTRLTTLPAYPEAVHARSR
jgi:SagB-type dehydrogenase family enzyme